MKTHSVLFGVVLVIAAGCTAAAVSPSAATPTASPPRTASPTPSLPPAATPGAQPPDALLSVAGGAPAKGEIGTYTWMGTGSDAPWLPGTPLKAASGSAASVALLPAIATTGWTARIAQPGDTQGTTAREIASGAGAGAITFTVPPGAGSLLVEVHFAQNAGDALYFWALSPG